MSQSILLPRPLSLPMRFTPASIHSQIITRVLNSLLSTEREEGELDFLLNKTLHVCVEDAGINFAMTLHSNRLASGNPSQFDMKISGNTHDFLLLINRKEDADTLFFQRRLKMEGNSELGLYLKNFLDGMDVESLPYYRLGNPVLQKGMKLYEKLFRTR